MISRIRFFRVSVVAVVAVLAATGYYASAWLVHHDAVYYRLGDAGFRWLTDLAKMVHFVGFVPIVICGLVFGMAVATFLPRRCHSPQST